MVRAGLSAARASRCEENYSLVFALPHNHIYLKHSHIKSSMIPIYLPIQVRKWLPLQRTLNCSVVTWSLFSSSPPPLAGCFCDFRCHDVEQQTIRAQRQLAQGTCAFHLVHSHVQIVLIISVSRGCIQVLTMKTT